uniref:Uncharacterized protein n=1 Tax=Romanomermis culicivorax TaxID=13658 RepID=A0A915JEP4_ROMCU
MLVNDNHTWPADNRPDPLQSLGYNKDSSVKREPRQSRQSADTCAVDCCTWCRCFQFRPCGRCEPCMGMDCFDKDPWCPLGSVGTASPFTKEKRTITKLLMDLMHTLSNASYDDLDAKQGIRQKPIPCGVACKFQRIMQSIHVFAANNGRRIHEMVCERQKTLDPTIHMKSRPGLIHDQLSNVHLQTMAQGESYNADPDQGGEYN